jgi:hypothetical protein
MKAKRLPPFVTKGLRRLVASIAILLLVMLGVCGYLRIWRTQDVVAYLELSRPFHPVWRDLAFGRISLGDAAAELFARHPAPLVIEHGPYTDYEYEVAADGYFPLGSLRVTAFEDKLIGAWAGSCTWHRTFFEDAEQVAKRQAISSMSKPRSGGSR